MGFPSKSEMDRVLKKLEKTDGTLSLKANATLKVDCTLFKA
jgi:hypothetical protein